MDQAESKSTMSTDFSKLAETVLGISCVKGRGQMCSDEAVKESVYKNLWEKRCLMVFDNAESYHQQGGIQKFLPSAIQRSWQTPTIIVTSRSRTWKQRVMQLAGLTEAEIWKFLSKCLKLEDTEENRDLSKKIGDLCEGLPLVLQQVWGLIVTEHKKRDLAGKGPYTMRDFWSEYHEGTKKYLKTKPRDSELSDSKYTIFSTTFEKLLEMKNGDLALRFLRMMSFLSPSCIPKKLFSSLIQKSEENAYPDALVMLKKYNLINVYDLHFEIHRIIQEVSVEQMKAPISSSTKSMEVDAEEEEYGCNFTIIDGILGYIMNALDEYLPKISPNDTLKQASFQNAFCVAFHSKRLFIVNGFPRFVAHLVDLAKDIYHSQTYALLCTMQTAFSAGMDKNASATSSITRVGLLWIKYKQAYVLDNMSKFDEALRLYVEITSSLEDEHESDTLLHVKSQMAKTLINVGRYEEAQELLEYLIHEKLQMEDNEAASSLRTDLSHVLIKRCRYEEALEIIKPLVEELEAAGSSWEACKLSTQHNLAMALMKMDQHDEALPLLQKVVFHNEHLLRKSHPDTLASKSTLVLLLLEMTKFQEALTMCQKVINEAVDVLEEDNVIVLRLKAHMASALERLSRFEEALAISEDVSRKWKSHGESHLEHLNIELNISRTELKLGRYERALSRLDHTIDSSKQTLGPEHDLTLASAKDKACVLLILGKLSDAEEIFREVLETEKKVFGLTHSSTLLTTSNLSRVLHKQGKFREALSLANEVVMVYEEFLGSGHMLTLQAKINRATTLDALGEESLSTYQTSLPKLLEITGNSKTHHVVLPVRLSLAAAIHNKGNIAESISLFEEIIRDCLEAGEVDPTFIIQAMKELAGIMKRTGRYNEARSLFEEAASRAKCAFGALDPRCIEAKISLAHVTRLLGNVKGSVALYRQAVEARESCYGPDSEKTEDAKLHLAATIIVNVKTISSIEEGLIVFEKNWPRKRKGFKLGTTGHLRQKWTCFVT